MRSHSDNYVTDRRGKVVAKAGETVTIPKADARPSYKIVDLRETEPEPVLVQSDGADGAAEAAVDQAAAEEEAEPDDDEGPLCGREARTHTKQEPQGGIDPARWKIGATALLNLAWHQIESDQDSEKKAALSVSSKAALLVLVYRAESDLYCRISKKEVQQLSRIRCHKAAGRAFSRLEAAGLLRVEKTSGGRNQPRHAFRLFPDLAGLDEAVRAAAAAGLSKMTGNRFYRDAFLHSGVSDSTALLILLHLSRRANVGGVCHHFTGRRQVAKKLGINEKAAQRGLARLDEAGVVTKIRNKGASRDEGAANSYTIHPRVAERDEQGKLILDGAKTTGMVGHLSHPKAVNGPEGMVGHLSHPPAGMAGHLSHPPALNGGSFVPHNSCGSTTVGRKRTIEIARGVGNAQMGFDPMGFALAIGDSLREGTGTKQKGSAGSDNGYGFAGSAPGFSAESPRSSKGAMSWLLAQARITPQWRSAPEPSRKGEPPQNDAPDAPDAGTGAHQPDSRTAGSSERSGAERPSGGAERSGVSQERSEPNTTTTESAPASTKEPSDALLAAPAQRSAADREEEGGDSAFSETSPESLTEPLRSNSSIHIPENQSCNDVAKVSESTVPDFVQPTEDEIRDDYEAMMEERFRCHRSLGNAKGENQIRAELADPAHFGAWKDRRIEELQRSHEEKLAADAEREATEQDRKERADRKRVRDLEKGMKKLRAALHEAGSMEHLLDACSRLNVTPDTILEHALFVRASPEAFATWCGNNLQRRRGRANGGGLIVNSENWREELFNYAKKVWRQPKQSKFSRAS